MNTEYNNAYDLNRQKNILIVDDLPDNLRVLSTTLQNRGYQVRCAKNGSTALMGVRTWAPSLILLDINMPDINGYEVCQKLKADEQTREIPVIFISALDDVLDKVKAFEVGGVDYINKPFQIEEVLARINNQLALQAAKAEIFHLNAQLEQRVAQRTAELEAANHKLRQEAIDRLQAQMLAKQSQEKLESILNSMQEVVWSAQANSFKLVYLNPAAEKVYGRPVTELLSDSRLWLDAIHPEERKRVEQSISTLLTEGSIKLEYKILRPDGELRWLSDRRHVIYDNKGMVTRIDGIIEDITKRKQAEEQLIYDALHDSLTGLCNRNRFKDRLDMAIEYAKRYKHYSFAVLFIDLDRFKIINDSLGHLFGDRLLVEIARLLEGCVRAVDTVARLGGDEFTIFLDGIEDVSDATKVADRIQKALKAPVDIDGHTVFTSASIGIVLSSQEYPNSSDILRDADIAMYRAKEKGKACYQVFDPQMHAQTLQLLQVENKLQRAIERQEFLLYYQPIVSLKAGKLIGFEALLRWQDPERGLIFPGEFIPLAEETGAIEPLGEWVLREACSQLRTWQCQFPLAANLTMSVNISSKQIGYLNFIEKLDGILLDTGLDGSYLRLEITESILVENREAILDTFLQIKNRKIQLSLDDFGTGYSSLSYLHRFPIDNLKIDRSFVGRMHSEPESFEIVRIILTLAHTLGIKAIAEGVETKEQLAQLRKLGCEEGQGYFFSKPLARSAAEKALGLLPVNNP